MTISNYRLPEIVLPTEKILDDEDTKVSAAFKVMWNGYKRAQKRTREILKAYHELESIVRNILKEHHEDAEKLSKNDPAKLLPDKNDPGKLLVDQNVPGKSFVDKNDLGKLLADENDPGKLLADTNDPGISLADKNDPGKSLVDKNNPEKLLIDKNTLKNNSSTPKLTSYEQKKSDMEQKEIEMIDLTAMFDFDRAGKAAESRWREISPELGDRRQRSSKKPIAASSQNDARQKVEEEMEKTALKKKRVVNKHESTSENQCIAGNEENKPPFCDSNLNSSSNNNSMLSINESRPIAKIGFAKTIYNIERSKTPNGKASKQSKLIFQPVATKSNIGSSEKKIITKSNNFGHCGGNLFEEDYRAKKKIKDGENSGQSKDQSNATTVKNSTETGSVDEESLIKTEANLIIPTASQIDETARSLFDDEDVDDFGVSHDLLNVCVRSPVLAGLAQEVESKDNVEKNKIPDSITSTLNASQFGQSKHSIDETFFAPAELMEFKPEMKANILRDISVAGCSTIAKVDELRESNRAVKRKSGEEMIVDTDKEMGDLGLQDINWDTEISNDDWTSPNRPINNSFDIPPEKKKSSVEYAYKGKVERNKAKRSKLRGWDCWQCENYYGKMDLPEEELRKRMDACSRHKSKYNQRYCTPAGFWNPEFPESTDSSDSNDNYPLHDRD